VTTHFHDFVRDNGLRITVEYTASAGESDFDYPGHICDGGGSGPEICILKAWPNTPGHNRLAAMDLALWFRLRGPLHSLYRFASWPLKLAIALDVWWRASLTTDERERYEAWLAERYEPELYDPADDY
jgi:hypothetical protein